ncbi:MAG: hypothetical protein IT370_23955 [Deltaproteobacteria bacterium]|nr:hypothetical protein [Deltaproteobacteria bacterium]
MKRHLHRHGSWLAVAMAAAMGCGGDGGSGELPLADAGAAPDGEVAPVRVMPEVVADRLERPFDLALDDQAAYWTSVDGSLMKADKATRAVRLLMAPTLGAAAGYLALDRDDVYVSDGGRGLLLRVAKTGGAAHTVAQGASYASGVAVDDEAVYWADAGNSTTGWVARIAKADGSTTKLVQQRGVWRLVLAGRVLHWIGPGEVRALSLDAAPGTSPALVFDGSSIGGLAAVGGQVLVSDLHDDVIVASVAGQPAAALLGALHGPSALAADAQSVYFANGRDGTLCRAPLGGGAVEVLAEGSRAVAAVAVDATHVYWLEHGRTGGQDGRLLRLPRAAPALPPQLALETVVRGQHQPSALASDDTAVYWTTQLGAGAGAVMRADKAAPATASLLSGPGLSPVGLAVDATSVYFANTSTRTLHAVDKRGGASRTIAGVPLGPVLRPAALAVDDTSVYWLNQGESTRATGWVERVAKDGATSYRVAEMQGEPLDVAVRGSTVAWVNGQGLIARADLAAAAGDFTVVLTGGQPNALLLENDAVVFTDYRQGTLATVSLSGGAVRVLARDLAEPNFLAADAGHYYVTCVGDGTVVAIPRAGGQPRVLATRQDSAQAIVVDADHVYWVTRGSPSRDSGELVRVLR